MRTARPPVTLMISRSAEGGQQAAGG